MENRDSGKTGAQNTYIDVSGRSLKFCTYDARDVILAANLQGLGVYGQTILMAWCFNFSVHRVMANIKDVRKNNPMYCADDILSKALECRLGAMKHKATFTDVAMQNMYWLDNWILAADYYVRVDELADVLNRVDKEMLLDLRGGGRIPMGLALAKLQEATAQKFDAINSMRAFVPYELRRINPMSEDTQKYLGGVLEELRMIRRKEEENGLD